MPTIPPVVRFDQPLSATDSYRPAADRIISGDPLQTAHVLYTSPDGRYVSGLWSCQPGKWRVVFTECEFCQILEGEIIITSDDGTTTTVRAGDTFVSPAGFLGTWEVTKPARKAFAAYE